MDAAEDPLGDLTKLAAQVRDYCAQRLAAEEQPDMSASDGIPPGNSEPDADNPFLLMAKATACVRSGDYAGALEAYAKAWDASHLLFPALLGKAQSLLAMGRNTKALESFEELRRILGDESALSAIGDQVPGDAVDSVLGPGSDFGARCDQAMVRLRQLATLGAASAHFACEDFEAALALYRQATGTAPEDWNAHYGAGLALLELEQYEDSLAAFREARRLCPDSADAHYGVGCAEYEMGRMAEAALSFREALRLAPDFEQAKRALEMIEEDG